ncbi:MAG: universal stress protein [Leptolyngbya sp.]|nr:universal stress protein [Candidatus Melainabacteria bacterium]
MKVLIAVDESQGAQEVIDAVEARTWPENSQFRIINVVEPVAYFGSEIITPAAAEQVVAAERECLELRKKHVEQLVQSLQNAIQSSVVSGDVLSGEIRQTIIEESNIWDADLIFLGTHQRAGISKLFLGSVSESIAKRSNCSIDIVKNHRKN